MNNFFNKQINDFAWDSSKVKNFPSKYFNGDKYQTDDKILVALLQKPSNTIIDNIPHYDMESITLNESHFDCFDNSFMLIPHSTIPVIKLK